MLGEPLCFHGDEVVIREPHPSVKGNKDPRPNIAKVAPDPESH